MGARHRAGWVVIAWLVGCATLEPATTDGNEGPLGRQIYEERCGQCHEVYPRHAYTASQWPAIMQRMGRPEAGLSDEESREVLRWLQEGG